MALQVASCSSSAESFAWTSITRCALASSALRRAVQGLGPPAGEEERAALRAISECVRNLLADHASANGPQLRIVNHQARSATGPRLADQSPSRGRDDPYTHDGALAHSS